MSAEDDDDDDDKPGRERRKIEIKFIQDKSRRHITFSKRKAGIMKKVRTFASPCPRLSPVTRVSRIFNPPLSCLNLIVLQFESLVQDIFRSQLHWTVADDSMRSQNRPMSSPSSQVLKYCCSSCPRPVSSTLSPLPSFNHW
jgi:hypothetical protein